jgi:hypothetical protein
MRRSWVWTLAGFVVPLLAGCQSQTAATPSNQSVDAAQPPTLSPEVAGPLRQFCESVFQAIAAVELRCTGRPLALFSKQFDVDYECKSLADAVARKRLAWEPGAGAACPDELRAARCADLRRRGTFNERWQLVMPACRQALRGLVQGEQKCGFVHYAFEECADADTVCSATSSCITGSCICQGSCQKRPSQRRQPCDSDIGCSGGLYCNASRFCDDPANLGEACQGSSSVPCAPGLVCAGGSYYTVGSCMPFRSDATTCANNTECASNNCVLGPGGRPPGFCSPFRQAGAPCGPAVGNCGADVGCKNGVCANPPVLGEVCRAAQGETVLTCVDSFCDTSLPREQLVCEPYVTGACTRVGPGPRQGAKDACGPLATCEGGLTGSCRSHRCSFDY